MELRVSRGPDKGLVVPLGAELFQVGTGAGCHLRLTDDTVSTLHCELRRTPDGIEVRDLGSTNGVVVAGARLLEALVQAGVKLTLGQTELQLKSTGDEEVALSMATRFGPLSGVSAAMRVLFAQLEAVAGAQGTLLLEGETGTGKERVAEALHHASPRKDGPFVVFDCGATAGSLIEAELFGHDKGAFTGAAASRVGLAESADGGTLVLDEIGELPLELQPKLLRLLESREVRPVGGNVARKVDVRIIACTHRSLTDEAKAGRFRLDLYYRLTALKVRLPALRERLEDLPLLVDQLFAQAGSDRRFVDLPENDQALLRSHTWPGNVRELRNVMERLATFPHLPASGLLDPSVPAVSGRAAVTTWAEARDQAQESFERRYLEGLLSQAEGSISEAARLADVSRQFMQRLLRKHALR